MAFSSLESAASAIVETGTAQPLESTPSIAVETATEQPFATADPMAVSQDVSGLCTIPNQTVGWSHYEKYTVQVNDTLSSLSRRTNTTLQQIQQANCRNLNDTLIYSGQSLYLPVIPIPVVSLTRMATLTAPAPGDPRIVVSPGRGTSLTIFTFEFRDYKPFTEILVSIEDPAKAEIFRFRVKMDAKGNLDVFWQSPRKLSPGFYTVKPYKPDGTLGKAGAFVIVPPSYP
jgi:hypothetical protein